MKLKQNNTIKYKQIHAGKNCHSTECLLVHRSYINQIKKIPHYSWKSARNVSFGFVYNVHQSDTCLPETRAPMGVLHMHYTKVKCVVVAAWLPE